MSAIRTARSRARAELTREIKAVARRQLARDGAGQLSLRAVARELEMVPSALYRYFASRDELLTALIIEAYHALGDAAERAVTALPPGDVLGRWRAGCHALRSWALERPHEFALLYGSPVPGYRAPEDTIAPATRVYTVLLSIVRDAHQSGQLASPPNAPALSPSLNADTQLLLTALDLPELPPAVLIRAITAWTQLIGGISLELFGHLQGAFQDNAAFFDHTIELMASLIGLAVDAPRERVTASFSN